MGEGVDLPKRPKLPGSGAKHFVSPWGKSPEKIPCVGPADCKRFFWATGKYGCTEVRVYPAECGEQLGRDPSKIGNSKSLVFKSFWQGTLWDSFLPVSLALWDTLALFTPPLPLPQFFLTKTFAPLPGNFGPFGRSTPQADLPFLSFIFLVTLWSCRSAQGIATYCMSPSVNKSNIRIVAQLFGSQ